MFDEHGVKYMTKYSEEADIFALEWLIRVLCADFFTDMTDEEMRSNPVTCAPPIERGPRAKVHSVGPQKVSRG
ncbi:hypothetical protein R1sor_018133 [Riccia sorocarpa]|uniref:Uncharacterized protein n=1 Tax=Riccia sorocarpa TaxID=122646 RepID=A0ABD3I9W5_9MARC